MRKPHIRRRAGAAAWWALLLACVGLAAALMPAGGAALYFGARGSDLVSYFYPNRVFVHRWLEQGVYPLWNPHVFGGYPVLESQQMALLNPLSLVTAALLPAGPGLAWFMALNVVLAAVLMMASLRHWWRLAPWASAAGALVWVFGAAFATRVVAGHVTVVAATVWWPPALLGAWGLARVARAGAPVRELAPLCVVVALMNALAMFSGAPQYVAYLLYAQAAAVVSVAGVRRPSLRALAWFGGAWALTAVVSAPLLLPTMEYLPLTGRGAGLPSEGGVRAFALLHLGLEWLLPHPFGDDVTRPHLHMKNVWETASYPGVLAGAAVLAVFARPLRRDARARLVVALLALAAFLFLGGWLPGFSGFREPLKARVLPGMAAALAVALALHRLGAAPRLPRAAARRVVLPVALALAAWGAASVVVGAWAWARPPAVRDFVAGFGSPMDPAALEAWNTMMRDPSAVARGVSTAALLASGLAVVMLALLAAAARLRRAWPVAAMAVLAGAELVALGLPGLVPRHAYADLELPPAFDRFLRAEVERTAADTAGPWRITLPPTISGRAQFVEGLAETGGYDPLMPLNANNRILLLPSPTGDSSAPDGSPRATMGRDERMRHIARATGRRHDLGPLSPRDNPARDAAPAHTDARIMTAETSWTVVTAENPEGFGPDLTGTHWVVATDPDEMERLRGAAEAGRATSATLVSAAAGPTPARMVMRVAATGGPALAVARVTWLPGWSVRVDGGPARPALRANGWVAAAVVPEGEHTVEFRYRPRMLTAGLWTSLAALAAMAGWVAWAARGRRRTDSARG